MTYPQYPYYPPVYGNSYPTRTELPQQYPAAGSVQQMPAVPQQSGLLKGRPVTSEEEARGIPVDFDGSVMVFPDAGHGMIYTKQLNMIDGTAIFRRYAQVPEAGNPGAVPGGMPPVKEYAEKREVEELRQLVAGLQDAVNAIPRRGIRRKEISDDESNGADFGNG